MTTSVTVESAQFVDVPGMPHVHTDKEGRRTITEAVTYRPGEVAVDVRITRIQVLGTEVQLGHHYHDFTERFNGIGGGLLYTAPADNPTDVTRHVLPEGGWAVDIPAGVVHTFVLSHPTVLVTRTTDFFVSEDNQNEHPHSCINTHKVTLDLSDSATA